MEGSCLSAILGVSLHTSAFGILGQTESVTSAWVFGILATSIVGNIVNGILTWLAHRAISTHDKIDDKRDQKIEKLEDMIAAISRSLSDEKDARHDDMKQQTDRLYEFSGDVRENYQKREEALSLFSSIARRVETGNRAVMERLENLPCNETRCPSQETQA